MSAFDPLIAEDLASLGRECRQHVPELDFVEPQVVPANAGRAAAGTAALVWSAAVVLATVLPLHPIASVAGYFEAHPWHDFIFNNNDVTVLLYGALLATVAYVIGRRFRVRRSSVVLPVAGSFALVAVAFASHLRLHVFFSNHVAPWPAPDHRAIAGAIAALGVAVIVAIAMRRPARARASAAAQRAAAGAGVLAAIVAMVGYMIWFFAAAPTYPTEVDSYPGLLLQIGDMRSRDMVAVLAITAVVSAALAREGRPSSWWALTGATMFIVTSVTVVLGDCPRCIGLSSYLALAAILVLVAIAAAFPRQLRQRWVLFAVPFLLVAAFRLLVLPDATFALDFLGRAAAALSVLAVLARMIP